MTVLGDPYFWQSLWHTLIITVVVVHVELFAGLGMALLFVSGLPCRRLLLAAALAPYAVSEVTARVLPFFWHLLVAGYGSVLLTPWPGRGRRVPRRPGRW